MKAYENLNSELEKLPANKRVQYLVSRGVISLNAIRDMEFCISRDEGKKVYEIADEWHCSEKTVTRALTRFR